MPDLGPLDVALLTLLSRFMGREVALRRQNQAMEARQAKRERLSRLAVQV